MIVDGLHAYFNFKTGNAFSDWNMDYHLGNEPWCTDAPGFCGNFVDTGKTSLDEVTTPPASGYIGDLAGFEDCQEIVVGNVLVFKLDDGMYGKVLTSNHEYNENDSFTGGCSHKLTLDYVYPM